LRGLLLDPAGSPVALAELLMLEAARAQLVARVVEPALAAGRWVLSDRFADSSLAYQSGARRLAPATVRRLNALACGDTVPDRTIVLELPVEEALGRARRRPTTTAANRRFEDEALAFHRAVARAYRSLARREPARVRLVDGSGTPEQVHLRVVAAVADLLSRRPRPGRARRRGGTRSARR
jgi:dTMP kinase